MPFISSCLFALAKTTSTVMKRSDKNVVAVFLSLEEISSFFLLLIDVSYKFFICIFYQFDLVNPISILFLFNYS